MKSVEIHPTALLDKTVELGEGVKIGPYAILKGRVEIGSGSIIESHAVIGSEHGSVKIGKNNHIYSSAMIGGPPQDLKFKGEPTRLEVGDDNLIREFVTMNVGTASAEGVTRVGSKNLIMAYVHIAHDCLIGNNVVIANVSQLAGHVIIEDHVRIAGSCAFNQFCRIGKYSFVTGVSAVNKDILPFSIAQGNHAVCRAMNSIPLENAGVPKEEVDNIWRAIRIVLKGSRTIEEALADIEKECQPSDNIAYFTAFIRDSKRGIAR